MTKKIYYENDKTDKSNIELLQSRLDPVDFSYDEYIHGIREIFSDQELYEKGKIKLEENSYLVFKQELEELLKEPQNKEKIKSILWPIHRYYTPYKKNIQFLERVYYAVFHDQPEFKPELIKTDIKELLEIEFGFWE